MKADLPPIGGGYQAGPLDTTTTLSSACAARSVRCLSAQPCRDLGTTLVNGLVQKIDTGNNRQGSTLHYADYSGGSPTGEQKSLDVDLIIGADGANSVAKAMDAGGHNVAIAWAIKLRPKSDLLRGSGRDVRRHGCSPDSCLGFPGTTTWQWAPAPCSRTRA